MNSITLIDSHCHFDFPEFDGKRNDIIQQCQKQGLSQIIIPAVAYDTWSRMLGVLDEFDETYGAIGLHPYFIEQHNDQHLSAIKKYTNHRKVIAIGEYGLDFYGDEFDEKKQYHFFIEQLKLAKELCLPSIIHSRKADDKIYKYLRQVQPERGGVIHAFAGSLQQAEKYMEQGFYLGFGGAATHQRANKLRNTLKQLPLERLLLETDAPDMRPAFDKEHPNSPVNLIRIAEILAEVKGVELSDLTQVTTQNCVKLFDLES